MIFIDTNRYIEKIKRKIDQLQVIKKYDKKYYKKAQSSAFKLLQCFNGDFDKGGVNIGSRFLYNYLKKYGEKGIASIIRQCFSEDWIKYPLEIKTVDEICSHIIDPMFFYKIGKYYLFDRQRSLR